MALNIDPEHYQVDIDRLLREWRQSVENSLPDVIPVIRNIHPVSIMDSIGPGMTPVDLDINSMYPYHMKAIEAPMSEEDAYLHRIGAR